MSAIEVRTKIAGLAFFSDGRDDFDLRIPDYPTAIALARAIEDAAEAFLKEREARGE